MVSNNTDKYSKLKKEAYKLMKKSVSIIGRRMGIERSCAHCLDEIAEENLSLVINDLKLSKSSYQC